MGKHPRSSVINLFSHFLLHWWTTAAFAPSSERHLPQTSNLFLYKFYPWEEAPPDQFMQNCILGNAITVGEKKVKSASQEWFRWRNPTGGVAGPPSYFFRRRRPCNHICHPFIIEEDLNDLIFLCTLAQYFSFSFVFAKVSSAWPPPPWEHLATHLVCDFRLGEGPCNLFSPAQYK